MVLFQSQPSSSVCVRLKSEKLENAEKVVELVGYGGTTDYPSKLSHQSEARLSSRLVVGLDGMPYIKEKSETDTNKLHAFIKNNPFEFDFKKRGLVFWIEFSSNSVISRQNNTMSRE